MKNNKKLIDKNDEFIDELTMMIVTPLVNCKSFTNKEKINLLKHLFNEK